MPINKAADSPDPLDFVIDAYRSQEMLQETIDIFRFHLDANDEEAAIRELDIAVPIFLANQFYGAAWGLISTFKGLRDAHYEGDFLD